MTKIYLIRHGKTEWNDLGIIQGLTDIPLNDAGRKEACELAKLINVNDFDICFCSPLIRAKETADIILQGKVQIIYDDLLKERTFGEYEGKKFDINLLKKQWDMNYVDEINRVESAKDCLERGKIFLNKILKKYSGKNILIVSHAGTIKSLHFNIIGYDVNTDFLSFYPKNTQLYSYELEDSKNSSLV